MFSADDTKLMLYCLNETNQACKRRSYEATHAINPYMDSEVAQALHDVHTHYERRQMEIAALSFRVKMHLEQNQSNHDPKDANRKNRKVYRPLWVVRFACWLAGAC